MPTRRRLALTRQRELTEIAAAIALVARGLANRVHLANLTQPVEVAADGADQARQAGVELHVERDATAIAIVVGPRQ
jgi:hypothetical protein